MRRECFEWLAGRQGLTPMCYHLFRICGSNVRWPDQQPERNEKMVYLAPNSDTRDALDG